jgi:hypothetical protein
MTKLQVKAFVLQLICFAILFVGMRFLVEKYTYLTGFWVPLTAFMVGTILAPKFQAVKTNDGEKLFMKWLFIKGIKQIK